MPYAVVLLFEESSIHPIAAIKKSLVKFQSIEPDQNEIPPHLTLAIFDDIDCSACEEKLEDLAEAFDIDAIHFDHLGLFTQNSYILFLAAQTSLDLLEFHAEVHHMLSASTSGSWQIYQPGRWVPHITLAKSISKDSLPESIELTDAINLPFSANIAQIGIIFFDPSMTIYQVDIQ